MVASAFQLLFYNFSPIGRSQGKSCLVGFSLVGIWSWWLVHFSFYSTTSVQLGDRKENLASNFGNQENVQ